MANAALGPGVSHASQGQSFTAFVSSLIVAIGIFFIQLFLFTVLRKRINHVYEPKTLLVPPSKRTIAPGASLFSWLIHVSEISLNEIQETCNLDEFFFLRFIRMLVTLFSISTLVLLPVLLPLNWLSGERQDSLQFSLDSLTWSHISPHHANRLSVHLVVVMIFITFTCWFIYEELRSFVSIRHTHLTSVAHRRTASANTILLRSVPLLYRNEENLLDLFRMLPGGVKKIWINRDYSILIGKIEERDSVLKKLETLLTMVICKCHKKAEQAQVQDENPKSLFANLSARIIAPYTGSAPNNGTCMYTANTSNSMSPAHQISPKTSFEVLELPGKLWNQYLTNKEMPRVKLAQFHILNIPIKLPCLSPSIDAITWYKAELNRLNAEVHRLQENYAVFEPINSCFIQFNNQLAAHLACQAVIFEDPQLAGLSAIEIDPRDINWNNLDISWQKCLLRHVLSTALNIILIVGWTFPVAVIGIVSQLDYLPDLMPGFHWIDHIPPRIRLIISSILPAIAMSVMMGVAPMLFRLLAKLKGFSTNVEVSLDIQSYLFPFMFIQVFLVVAISRGTTAVIAQVVHLPFTALTLLAYNVPKGANFFYSYIFLQGLAVSGEILLQASQLAKMYVVKPLFSKTAHEKFSTMTMIEPLDWGSVYPGITILAVIGMVYSVVAPLITFFAAMSFGLLYLAYKYRILYCNIPRSDSMGCHFPKAVFHLMLGVYCLEICMIGLFIMARDASSKPICIIHTVFMGFVLAATGIFHYRLCCIFKPIMTYIPVCLGSLEQENSEKLEYSSNDSKHPQHNIAGKNGNQRRPSIRSLSEIFYPRSRHGHSWHTAAIEEEGHEQGRGSWNINSGVRAIAEDHKHGTSAELFEGIETTLGRLTPEQREHLVSRAFHHLAVRAARPCIWIPRDRYGIAEDQIRDIRLNYPHLLISVEGCLLNEKGQVIIKRAPPDYDPTLQVRL